MIFAEMVERLETVEKTCAIGITGRKENIMNELQITKAQDKYVASYNKAVAGCVKSAWGLAEVVHKTINAKDFSEVFGSVDAYAKHLNVAKSTISKLAKSYERKLLIESQEQETEFPAIDGEFSVGQIEEFGKVPMAETMTFIVSQEVSTKDTTKTIREKAKEYLKAPTMEDTETEFEDSDEQEEQDDTINDSMFVSYKGTEYQITNDDIINAIIHLLKGE